MSQHDELERSLVELRRGAEDLLDALRSRTIAPAPEMTSSLAALLDAMRALLAHVPESAQADEAAARRKVTPRAGPLSEALAAAPARVEGEPSLLLAKGAGGVQLAVSLSAVQRLEQLAPERLTRGGDGDVIRYGDAILPVIWVEDLMHGAGDARRDPDAPRARPAETIVCLSSAGPLGLVVDTIEDVVPRPHVGAQPSSRPGVACRLLIDSRPTELLDIEALVVAARDRGQSL